MKKSNSSRNPKNPASLLSDECVPEIVNKFLENNTSQIGSIMVKFTSNDKNNY